MRVLRGFFASALTSALIAGSACSSSNDPDAGSTVGTGGSGAGAGAAGAGALGGFGAQAGNVSIDSGLGAAGNDSGLDGPVCGAVEATAAQKPIDLFIMLDKSTSMVSPEDIWTPVKSAIRAFVQSMEASGIGVGLGNFPQGFDEPQVCMANYAMPTVPIAQLPGAAMAFINGMDALVPGGQTPTSAALRGALQYAKTWAAAHLDRQTIVVLATDGEPNQCDPIATAQISQFAADALAQEPKVFTAVIGIGDLGNLNPIAEGGGTKQAFIVDPANQNFAQELTQALLRIATSPLGCEFPLPPPRDGGTLNTSLVNVDFTPAGGGPKRELVQVRNAGECSRVSNGWYYDNATLPTKILICDSACNSLGAGTLQIVLGCQTRVPL